MLKPYPDGGSEGYEIPFNDMLEAYYLVRGWDFQTGYPHKDKLNELGLDWVRHDDRV
jgi:aldehyde:ferredoxin oxidoreductase